MEKQGQKEFQQYDTKGKQYVERQIRQILNKYIETPILWAAKEIE